MPNYNVDWVNLLRSSLLNYVDRHLVAPDLAADAAAIEIFNAPYMLVSHDRSADPIFNYGNRTALELFEMDWQQFILTPSRLSAEPVERSVRDRLLERVTSQGFIDNYSCVRVSKNGRRFTLEHTIIWNVIDQNGTYRGQAAICDRWQYLDNISTVS
jgi:MEKHLA domain